jgi:cell division protein ZapA
MPQVQVTIAGKGFRMACGEGEEAHLEGLARILDAKIEEMRAAFGEIGDMRLHVMAALTIVDEAAELRRRVEALEGELLAVRLAAEAKGEQAESADAQMAAFILRTSERVERLAKSLNSGPEPEES